MGHGYAGGGAAALANPRLSGLWVSVEARGIERLPRDHAGDETANSRRERRLYGIDVADAAHAINKDLLYKLRVDGNPLPLEVDPSKWTSG